MKRAHIGFTQLELAGLVAIADEGAEGLLTDPKAAKSYIGNGAAIAAARRALDRIRFESARMTARYGPAKKIKRKTK